MRTAFMSLARAMVKGFVRDRQAVFFSVFFPLMFLVLFGGVFSGQSTSRINLVEVGNVTIFHQLPRPEQAAFRAAFDVSKSNDLAASLEQVRKGDADAALQQVGHRVVLHFSRADQVKSSVAEGTIQGFVQAANLAATGRPPTFTFATEQVEDKSLKTIQYVTPGLLGWAIATSATFGAAATLVGWRRSKLLRRLRLAPVSTRAVVGARIGVTLLIGLVQMAIFIGLAVVAFGLQLTGYWWMAVPLVVCGTLSFMALGLLAGAISKTVEGASALANIFVLPMAFLSGSFFPLDNAPGWLNVVSHLLPLRYLNDGMLDVMVRGDGPGAVVRPIAILVAFAVVVIVVASRFFRWDAD
ncbi:MAG: type transport system permease protein [Nocardioidaceae bacterium]|nr:type transport system permease protein [Nocardioidaceae bacterium]